jgi:hypothetical protein
MKDLNPFMLRFSLFCGLTRHSEQNRIGTGTFTTSTNILIDSLGALLSAVMLGIVLARLEPVFGMPEKALYYLSFIACIFSVYSFMCFFRKVKNWKIYLKVIALANLLYGCLTTGLVIYFYPKLTALGVTYFVLELIVISVLVMIEIKAAQIPE